MVKTVVIWPLIDWVHRVSERFGLITINEHTGPVTDVAILRPVDKVLRSRAAFVSPSDAHRSRDSHHG